MVIPIAISASPSLPIEKLIHGLGNPSACIGRATSCFHGSLCALKRFYPPTWKADIFLRVGYQSPIPRRFQLSEVAGQAGILSTPTGWQADRSACMELGRFVSAPKSFSSCEIQYTCSEKGSFAPCIVHNTLNSFICFYRVLPNARYYYFSITLTYY